MKKLLILTVYIILFWIVLPGIIVLSSARFDQLFGFRSVQGLASGILLLGFALPLLVVSIVQFRRFSGKYPVSADPPEHFIRTGLYAVWRHPIYLFFTLVLIGTALVWGSGGMLFISIPAFILLEVIYIIVEENTLVRRFSDSYVHYRKITPVVIPRFYYWLKIPFFFLFRCLFSYKASGQKNIPDSPPFFLVSTHRNYLDPFFLAQSFPYQIRYITTFEMYRSRKIRWFFKALDCIPKKRFLNDVSTGYAILRALKQDAVIGVFPEGERVWTGAMIGFKPETLNLFRKLNHIPILPVKLQGNFFAWPRWGNRVRRAPVKVEFQEPLKIDKAWDERQIEERIRAAIDPDDLNHQDFYCRSQRRIEDISKVIYRCPLCRSFESIVFSKDRGDCFICGSSIELDERYHLTCRNEEGELKGNLDEVYQHLRISIEDLDKPNRDAYPEEAIISFSEDVELSCETQTGMEIIYKGRMTLTKNKLVFTEDPDGLSIPLDAVSSVTTESNCKLQIYDCRKEKLYQLVFGMGSILKWQDLIAASIEKEFTRKPNLR